MDQKFQRRCQSQCDSCVTWFGAPSASSNPMEDPPTRADLEAAAALLERTAIDPNLSDGEGDAYKRVAAFARALAPMMDMLHDAIASGTLPDVSRFIPGM